MLAIDSALQAIEAHLGVRHARRFALAILCFSWPHLLPLTSTVLLLLLGLHVNGLEGWHGGVLAERRFGSNSFLAQVGDGHKALGIVQATRLIVVLRVLVLMEVLNPLMDLLEHAVLAAHVRAQMRVSKAVSIAQDPPLLHEVQGRVQRAWFNKAAAAVVQSVTSVLVKLADELERQLSGLSLELRSRAW